MLASPELPTTNPFAMLINECADDPVRIRERYIAHRTTRLATQRALLLSSPNIAPDAILARLQADSTFSDPRHVLTVWARPPARVRALVRYAQDRLATAVPGLYLAAEDRLHMTVLDIASDRTDAEVTALAAQLGSTAEEIARLIVRGTHRARLTSPRLSYDRSGVALCFLAAADSATRWGYHHLRRDIYELVAPVIPVASRYMVPSAHLACARFVQPLEEAEVRMLVETVDAINDMLESAELGDTSLALDVGPWTVGEEHGLEIRAGPCWYGYGGKTIHLGQAIDI